MESIQQHYDACVQNVTDKKHLLIAYLDNRDAPNGLNKLYEKGYWEYQQAVSARAKAFGKLKAAQFLHGKVA